MSPGVKDDLRLEGLLKKAWLERGGIYDDRKHKLDMRIPAEALALAARLCRFC